LSVYKNPQSHQPFSDLYVLAPQTIPDDDLGEQFKKPVHVFSGCDACSFTLIAASASCLPSSRNFPL
jgi:hypothetical protein